jgi:hypothetical protein
MLSHVLVSTSSEREKLQFHQDMALPVPLLTGSRAPTLERPLRLSPTQLVEARALVAVSNTETRLDKVLLLLPRQLIASISDARTLRLS